jgi:hypothetical protein
MINTNFRFTPDETQFNKFHNLDSIETRIINYLKDTNTDDCNRLWKLLRYSDMKALYKDNSSEIIPLNSETQEGYYFYPIVFEGGEDKVQVYYW